MWVHPRQPQERVREVMVRGGHQSRFSVWNPKEQQTQRLRLRLAGCRWGGRGGRAPDSLPRSRNPKANIPVWLWARFLKYQASGTLADQAGCEAWSGVQLSGVPGRGAGVLHGPPGCFPRRPSFPLSHPACGGGRLTLFSVLAGEGRMPKAGGPQERARHRPANGGQTAAA